MFSSASICTSVEGICNYIDVISSFLSPPDDGIGPRGALALGSSLSAGKNLSLCTLKLDYNVSIGAEGVVNLCKGLRTNISLMELHLSYCQVTHEAGPALAEVLANARYAPANHTYNESN